MRRPPGKVPVYSTSYGVVERIRRHLVYGIIVTVANKAGCIDYRRLREVVIKKNDLVHQGQLVGWRKG